MPFTPYHFGAGALAKSIAPRHFSFTAFAVSNVLIDVEPLVRMLGLLDDTILHGPTHTFPGAVVIAALTLPAVRLWDRTAAALRLTGLRPPAVPTWMVLTSALVGTVSHVILDSWMHADMAEHVARYPGLTKADIPPAPSRALLRRARSVRATDLPRAPDVARRSPSHRRHTRRPFAPSVGEGGC